MRAGILMASSATFCAALGVVMLFLPQELAAWLAIAPLAILPLAFLYVRFGAWFVLLMYTHPGGGATPAGALMRAPSPIRR